MKTYINNVDLLGMVGCVNSNSDIIHFSLVTILSAGKPPPSGGG